MHSIRSFIWFLAFASLLASGLRAEDLEVVYDDVGKIPVTTGDDDNDGISNLLEYAFGLDTQANSSGKLPGWQRNGDHVVAEFSNPAGISGIIYGAEWSVDMNPQNWIGIQDSGSGDVHRFSVPVPSHGNLFVRLKITTP